MTLLTINDYIAHLKEHIENVDHKPKYNVLLSPSPAQLRDYCLILCDEGNVSIEDKNVLKDFFKANSIELSDISNCIRKFDIERFKPIQYFLNGKTTMSKNHMVIEMVALMYDYEQRPYSRFRKKDLVFCKEEKSKVKQLNTSTIDANNRGGVELEDSIKLVESKGRIGNTYSKSAIFQKNKLWYWLLGVVLMIGLLLLVLKLSVLSQNDQCMRWVVDKYEECDCGEATRLSFIDDGVSPIKFDQRIVEEFKKIEVSCNTVFFKNSKPKIWFVKISARKHEYFNGPGTGIHPTLGKPLKPITKYHLDKYIYPQCP
ncbi:hypothetical protein [Myroides pelagicus]|uniref:Uncharacterized protein n=1 Tax=Myroides pelagicus TaxID=270914 RepID=A0A7K1GIN6_9FLAO|nr:hypothetical protein [Myroides pelagicus]MEC4112886.1 hypothetical protein [Myroides pelagicus]MTH28696.1 hypothetical protein [Myroides pelagicus]